MMWIISFKLDMHQEEILKRGRLCSQAITASEEPTLLQQKISKSDESSPHQKPKDDPDSPPQLSLQDCEEESLNPSYFENLKIVEELDQGGERRQRKFSQGNAFTFISFLEKKTKNIRRLMSEQIPSQTICLPDPQI